MPTTFNGTAGNDTYSTSDGDGSTLSGLSGNDKLTIKTGDNAMNSVITGGDDNDKLSISAEGDISYNTIDGGSGDDQIALKTTNLRDSEITLGDGSDRVKIDLSDDYGVTLAQNTLNDSSGDSNTAIKMNGGDGFASAIENQLSTGIGDDKFSADLKGKNATVFWSNDLDFGDGDLQFKAKAVAPGKADISLGGITFLSNSISAGDGTTKATIDLKSTVDNVRFRDNDLDFETGTTILSLKATSSKADVYFTGNTIATSGISDNQIKFQVSAGDSLLFSGNNLLMGAGNDRIDLNLKSDKDTQTGAINIDSGDGDDQLTFKSTSKDSLSSIFNTIFAGDGDDKLKLDYNATESLSFAQTTIDLGEGDNVASLKFATKSGELNFQYNEIRSGNGADDISLDLSGNTFSSSSRGNLFSTGEGDDDLTIKLSAKSGTSRSYGTIDLGNGNNHLLFEGKSVVTEIRDDIAAEEGNDILEVKLKGAASFLADTDLGDGDNLFDFRKSKDLDIRAELTGGSGDDQILTSGKNLSTSVLQVFAGDGNNMIDLRGSGEMTNTRAYAGTGDDTLQIHSNNSGYSRVSESYIELGSGVNSISLETSTSAKDYNAKLFRNTIIGGDGDDAISLSSKSNTGIAYNTSNLITAGDGNNVIELSATGKGEIRAANTITSGDGNDKITFDFETKGDEKVQAKNSLNSGAGNDEILFSASSKGAIYGNVYGSTGAGNDTVAMMLESKNSKTQFNFNDRALDLGEGNDSVDMSAIAGGNIEMANQSLLGGDGIDQIIMQGTAGAVVDMSNNDFDLGAFVDDGEQILVNLQGEEIAFDRNNLTGSLGDDTISLELAASGYAEVELNTMDSGDSTTGDNLLISLQADTLRAVSNDLIAGGGNDLLTLEVTAQSELTLFSSDVEGGDGDDQIRAIIHGGDSLTASGLYLRGQAGADDVYLSLGGTPESFGAIELVGGTEDDDLRLLADLGAGDGDAQAALEGTGFGSGVVFDGGDGHDRMIFENTGQVIDLALSAPYHSDMEEIVLKGENQLILAEIDAQRITDSDNQLFVSGSSEESLDIDLAEWTLTNGSYSALGQTWSQYTGNDLGVILNVDSDLSIV